MTTNWPKLYPQEIIKSYAGRVKENLLLSKSRTDKLLFGSINHTIHRDLPRLTDCFISNLQQIGITYEVIINEHTVVPFYENFLNKERLDSLYKYLKNHEKNVGALSFANSEIHYCPICVKEDFEKYGETYWRRTHNLSSIKTCYIHKCYLEQAVPDKKLRIEFSPNEGVHYNLKPTFCKNEKLLAFEKQLIQILFGEMKFDRNSLIKDAVQKGLIELKSQKYFFVEDKLQKLKSYELEVIGKTEFVLPYHLKRTFNNNYNGSCPELYLLISNFLKGEKVLKNQNQLKINISCNNKLCSNFKKLILNNEVKHYGESKSVIRQCPNCGIYYSKVNNKLTKTRIVFLGSKVINNINKEYTNKVAIKKIASNFGIGLHMVNSVINGTHKAPQYLNKPTKEVIHKYRKAWMSILESKNFESIKKSRDLNQALCSTLHRHDKEWISKVNNQYRKRSWLIRDDEFYKKKDLEYLAKLNDSLIKLKKIKPEERITFPKLSKLTKHNFFYDKDKYPLSYGFIIKNKESFFEFKLRKIANLINDSDNNLIILKSHIIKKYSFRSNKELEKILIELKKVYGLEIRFV